MLGACRCRRCEWVLQSGNTSEACRWAWVGSSCGCFVSNLHKRCQGNARCMPIKNTLGHWVLQSGDISEAGRWVWQLPWVLWRTDWSKRNQNSPLSN